MIKIQSKITRENDEIELTIWEVDTDKDYHLFGIEIGEKINTEKKLLVNISFQQKYLAQVLNELENIEQQIEEEAENNEGDYDGSKEQALDDLQRTELAALKKQGF